MELVGLPITPHIHEKPINRIKIPHKHKWELYTSGRDIKNPQLKPL